jgi:hypothetical protein
MREGFELEFDRKHPTAKTFRRVRAAALAGRVTTCLVLAIWLVYMLVGTTSAG